MPHPNSALVPATTSSAGADPACRERRACLRVLAAAASLGLPSCPKAALPAPSERLWLQLFAGPSGGPVFWLTRGTEFIVVDGTATPVKGRISAIAAVARPRDGDSTRVSYLLQGVSATAIGFDLVASLVHPLSGEESSTAVAAPLKLGWLLDRRSGELTESLVAANGTRATYRGVTWESPGSGDERSATVEMNIRLDRPNGAVETFNEISKIRRRTAQPGEASAGNDFIPAESETFTVHPLPDPAKFKGTTALSMSMNHGVNHRSAPALRAALRPAESAALSGFFEQLPGWLHDT